MQTRHPINTWIVRAISMVFFLSLMMWVMIPCDAGGLPRDLGLRMSKISASETGQAGEPKSNPDAPRVERPRIQSDPATINLSTERIELSEIMALIKAATSPAKAPDVQTKMKTEVEEVKAAEL